MLTLGLLFFALGNLKAGISLMFLSSLWGLAKSVENETMEWQGMVNTFLTLIIFFQIMGV